MPLQALIWDVDGTLAETEHEGHLVAFNRCFEEQGLPWRWEDARYAKLLHVTGGTERLLADMAERPGAPRDEAERLLLARAIHQRKNVIYGELLAAGAITARPGVLRLMREASEAGVVQAIATTTSRVNLEGLCAQLLGPDWRDHFGAVVCGEDVRQKKPHPEAYLRALRGLGVNATNALAIEDSPPGLAAATAAGLACLVTRSRYFADFEARGAALVCAHLDEPGPGREAGVSLEGLSRLFEPQDGPGPRTEAGVRLS